MMLEGEEREQSDLMIVVAMIVMLSLIPAIYFKIVKKGDIHTEDFQLKFSNLTDQICLERNSYSRHYVASTLVARQVFIFTPILMNWHAWL